MKTALQIIRCIEIQSVNFKKGKTKKRQTHKQTFKQSEEKKGGGSQKFWGKQGFKVFAYKIIR